MEGGEGKAQAEKAALKRGLYLGPAVSDERLSCLAGWLVSLLDRIGYGAPSGARCLLHCS